MIIEDDVSLHEGMKETIMANFDLEVESYFSGEEFFENSGVGLGKIYIVDWHLPGILGPEIVRRIRAVDKIAPVFMISGFNWQSFINQGLDSGADDYFIKPFNEEQFLKKLRNAKIKTSSILGNLMDQGVKLVDEVDMVMRNGKKARLSSREYQVFKYLYENAGEVNGRKSVVSSFKDSETTERNIDFIVSSLRKKITHLDIQIETIRGQGYRIPAL